MRWPNCSRARTSRSASRRRRRDLEFRLTAESVDVTAPAPAAAVSSPKYTQPLREVPQTIEVIPQAVMRPRASRRSARRCATSPASRCRQAKAAARRTPPATCSTCAASTPPTASSWTACATTGWCRETSSTSSRSRCSWDQPAPTSAAAPPPGYVNMETKIAASGVRLLRGRSASAAPTRSGMTLDFDARCCRSAGQLARASRRSA